MIGIVGIVIVFVMVFGGYVIAGGKIGIILHSLPYEMMMIAGAATGAFVISTTSTASPTRSRTSARSSRARTGRPRTSRTCSA